MALLTIDGRFTGPPTSGNGGVTCGLLASFVDAPAVQVTLRLPPPVDTPLQVTQTPDGATLHDGDALVAEAVPGTLSVTPPPPVSLADATAAAGRFLGYEGHPFPTCFVCGTARTDGLGLYAGPVSEGHVACVWTPTDNTVPMVWAALDCPGGWSADLPGRPMVLGRMTTRIDALPVVGEPHVVQGWLVGGEGRKVQTASALHTADGALLALTQATWITIA